MKKIILIIFCFVLSSCSVEFKNDERKNAAVTYGKIMEEKCRPHGGTYFGETTKEGYFTLYCQDCSTFEIKRFENYAVEKVNPNEINKCK